jgi:hypothetical protein
MVIKCPYCSFGGGFKTLKTWKYKWWNVYFYECPSCNGKFRYQLDPEGKRKEFVMKVGTRARSR